MTLSITCCWLWSKLQLSSGAIKALIGGLSWWSEYQGAGSISESESIVTESLGEFLITQHSYLAKSPQVPWWRPGEMYKVCACTVKPGCGLKSGNGLTGGCNLLKLGFCLPDLKYPWLYIILCSWITLLSKYFPLSIFRASFSFYFPLVNG